MFGLTTRRRQRLRSQPFPEEWVEIILRNVPYYRVLPEEDRRELYGHIMVLLSEKHFEGCGGLDLTDEILVTIAAHACVLLLHRETDYYPNLKSIVVYPDAFIVPRTRTDESGLVEEEEEVLSGESWSRGTLVLSWHDVKRRVSRRGHHGQNVVIHEFAHELDHERGGADDGVPILPEPSMYAEWARVMEDEYERLVRAVERSRPTVIDPYGAESPAEFFAVVTESFFEDPIPLRERHRELYELLSRYYAQDPARLLEQAGQAP